LGFLKISNSRASLKIPHFSSQADRFRTYKITQDNSEMQPSFFDVDQRHEEISKMGDPLEKLNECIPWDDFVLVLSELDHKERKSNAGRKAYPAF